MTRDFGDTFLSTAEESETASLGPNSRVALAADPLQSGVVWAASDGCCGESGVYRYTRKAGWVRVALDGSAERWARNVAVNPVNSNHVVVVTGQDPYVAVNGGTGVWVSLDGGASFRQQNYNLPILRFTCVTFNLDGTELFVGSGGRGFFRAPLPQGPATLIRAEAERLTVGAGQLGVYTLARDPSASGGAFVVPDQDSPELSVDSPSLVFVFTLPSTSDDQFDTSQLAFRMRCRGIGKIYARLDFGAWDELILDSTDWEWNGMPLQVQAIDWHVDRHTVYFRSGGGSVALDVVEVDLKPDPVVIPTSAPTIPAVQGTTDSPMMAPTPAPEPSLCFSAFNTVEVLGKGEVPLPELAIGDYVRAGDSRFSRIHGFYHLNNDVEATFLRIATNTSKVLEVSEAHLVFVDGVVLRVSSLRIGDRLGESCIVAIEAISRRGLYSPAALSGDIVVSGILVSTYSSHVDQASVNEHIAANIVLTYHRFLCRFYFHWCERENYTEFGVSTFVSPLTIFSGILRFGPCVQMMVAVLISPVCLSLYLVEATILSPFLVLAIAAVLFVWP